MSADYKFMSWGLGNMGTGVARELIRKGWRITEAVSHQVGEDIGTALGLGATGASVIGFPPRVVPEGTQLCVISTSSRLPSVAPQIRWALEQRLNVICSAEELAYPWRTNAALSEELHKLAISRGVSILGTGINPGLLMDVLPVFLTASSNSITQLRVRRVNDLAPFGKSVLDSFGVGLTPEQFSEADSAARIPGHIGFLESIHMISDALGLGVDRIEESKVPIVSNTARQTATGVLPAGVVVGCTQTALAYSGDRLRIHLEHPQQVDPAAEGTETGDFVEVLGEPNISMKIQPEVPGGIGTIAVMANSARALINAKPGLLTMLDMPLPQFVAP